MGILDEAIREHLELKRAHGADDSELKQLEDQAFGPPERPGADGTAGAPATEVAVNPAAEAPTEFMAQPDLGEGQRDQPAPGRREPAAGLADIQEGPEEAEEEQEVEPPAEEDADEPVSEEDADDPLAEEQPAAEHEAIPEPQGSPGSHTTEERHTIADQPTEMFDVEEEFASTEAPAPADEDLLAEEIGEARLGPAPPLAPEDEPSAEEDEDDDFFDEQRLSDELDQALEAPVRDPEPEPVSDEHEALREQTGEHEAVAEHTDEHEQPADKRDRDEDVLEETPDFLEEAPEDDQLWFEQKPPKDFDFDD